MIKKGCRCVPFWLIYLAEQQKTLAASIPLRTLRLIIRQVQDRAQAKPRTSLVPMLLRRPAKSPEFITNELYAVCGSSKRKNVP